MPRDPLHFWKKYEKIASTIDFNPIISNTRKCRFCKKNENDTTFLMDAHVIPELLGANNILTLDECDECNKLFSRYESHLSTYFLPYLTMAGVKGKHGIPQFHSRTNNRDEKTRTIITSTENKRQIQLGDILDYEIDQETKTGTITFRKAPHRPLWVYKALCKIGLSLIPEDAFSQFDEVCKWLIDDSKFVSYFVTISSTLFTVKKFKHPYAELFRVKRILYNKSFLPEYTMVLGFGNVMIQIFLPLSSNTVYERAKEKKPVLNFYPSFIHDDFINKKKSQMNFIDLKGNETVSYNQKLHFTFLEAELNIHDAVSQNSN